MKKLGTFLFFFCCLALININLPIILAEENKVCFKDTCIQVELADTPEKRMQGLMFREKLQDNKGMLFIFHDDGYPSIWMKNMRFDLDIIWIDNNNIIVDIKKDFTACRGFCEGVSPKAKARYVLEVSAGFSDKYGIKQGDKISF
ncbi:MAG: DUF192 domain-containing protein [Candidatus Omnitrophota bacterium]|nr:DUF192 domain-containing protein [Candidatus Omnitrophota bacterium]